MTTGKKILIMKPEDLLGKGAFEKKKTISADIELKASEQPYAIIPCTFYPDTENSFSVSVTPSTSPSDLRLRACADDWRKAVASVSPTPHVPALCASRSCSPLRSISP